MTVDPATPPHHATHDGTDYHFCSAGCRTKFLADPQRYLHPDQAEPLPPPPPGTRHTCPMHPEIVQDGPGTCPICGMALEPEMPGLDDGENPELTDFRRRSEEHTSELQSLMRISYAVFCLKKKKK